MNEIAAPTSSRRLTAEERRHQIIDSATGLFAQHGLKGTTTKALAEAAGVSEATIFKHFRSKDDLYAAAFERRTAVGTAQLVTELERLADTGVDEPLLVMLYKAVLLGYANDRDLHRMLLYAYLEQGTEENERLMAQIRQSSPLFGFLARYVERRQAEGRFVTGAVDILTAAILALPVQHAISTKLYGLGSQHADDEVATTLARLMLDGLRSRPDLAP